MTTFWQAWIKATPMSWYRAKTRQSEQGALKQGGIDLLVMPPKLKGRLPLWRVCSVKWLRRLVKRRN